MCVDCSAVNSRVLNRNLHELGHPASALSPCSVLLFLSSDYFKPLVLPAFAVFELRAPHLCLAGV